MTRNAVVSPDLPEPVGPFSHAVEKNGVVHTAGFGPQDPVTGDVPDGIEAQTAQVLANVRAALEAAGVSLDDVVKTTVHLQNLKEDFAGFNRVYAEFFAAPYPVRTTVGSQLADILVEIDAVAIRSQG